MPDARRQFRILYRDFLFRMVDLEALTAHGDIQRLLGQLAAVLAAMSFTLAVAFVPRYVNSRLPAPKLLVAAWGDEEFLIATTIAVVGIFAVIAWNAMLPDRRDCLVLGPLPVSTFTIFRAKLAAIATALGVSVVAINIFTGLTFPFLLAEPGTGALGGLRALAGYWITMFDAGLLVFSALLAVQGIAAQLLSYRVFLRISGPLQLIAFFLILSVYFLTPPLASPRALADPLNQRLLAWLPSYWFLGLFQTMNGSAIPAFGWLARHAMRNVLFCSASALVTYALAYYRHIRRIIEQPDIAPGDRSRRFGRWVHAALYKLSPRALDRAILLFTARSIARSRQHRLLLAAYSGAALAIGLAYAKSIWNGRSVTPWYALNRPLLVGSLVLLCFAVIGARAVFALPLTLRANWIFRITAVRSPAKYFAAVRRALFTLTVIPICLLSAVAYFAIWPGRPALEHTLVLVVIGAVILETALYQYRKIPFTCSYLPGGTNVNVKLGIYGIVFLLAAEIGTQIEFWALAKQARMIAVFGVLLAAVLWTRRRTADDAAAPENQIQFEELPPEEVYALDLQRDGASPQPQVRERIDSYLGRTLGARIRPIGVAVLVLLACGFCYERIGSWRDSMLYPQVGRRVDIGGRWLNVSCLGEGSPTVVLESNIGEPGLSWAPAQREIARFTRACWYDRAGSGWSDPGPSPNHSDSAARDLHQLLPAAGIVPPYVLVGNSGGGPVVRVFNGMYRQEVAGMVLVDPAPEKLPGYASLAWLQRPILALAGLAGQFGLIRLFAPDPGPPTQGFTTEEWYAISSLRWQAKSLLARVKEGPAAVDAQLADAAGGLEDLPLAVLSRETGIQLQLQTEIAQLSARGKLIVAPAHTASSTPERVTAAVREVLAEIEAHPSLLPTAHFRTVVESRP